MKKSQTINEKWKDNFLVKVIILAQAALKICYMCGKVPGDGLSAYTSKKKDGAQSLPMMLHNCQF